MMDVVLGVDIGTTSAKVVVVEPGGATVRSAEVEYPVDEPRAGVVEQDAERVAGAALEAVRRVAWGKVRIAGVAFSSAMHSLVALDADGVPLTPLVTWADTRAVDQAERLRREHPELHARTGTPLHPMSPLVKLMWFRERMPDVVERARRWVGIKELVTARLTGEWVIDASCASGTGLMSLGSLDWDDEILDIAGVRREQLSRVVPATETFATPAASVGLAAGTRVTTGAGDGPLANLGVGAVGPGVGACSIGASGALRVVVDRPAVDSRGRLFCYALTPGRWVAGGAINNGGSVLEWTGAALAPDIGVHAGALLDIASQAPPGSDGLVMLPYLHSERAPHWSAVPRGAYVGLTQRHRRPHLVRAAIEGVCQQLALVLESLEDAGHEVRELRATGGFARSPMWRQLLTDVLGIPVGFTTEGEGAAFGAAIVGLQAVGLIDCIDRATDLVRIDETLLPDPASARTYRELRPIFAALYDQLAPAFQRMREIGREQEHRIRRPAELDG